MNDPIQEDKKLFVFVQGEANEYMIMSKENWLFSLRVNGEIDLTKQIKILTEICDHLNNLK